MRIKIESNLNSPARHINISPSYSSVTITWPVFCVHYNRQTARVDENDELLIDAGGTFSGNVMVSFHLVLD